MSISVRPADLNSDRATLITLFRQYLTSDYDSTKFEWLYQRAPHGRAFAWLAFDNTTGAAVGAAAAFTRRLHAGGLPLTGLVLGDFCISEGFRTLGPSLQLQRACLGLLDSQNFDFLYDFPSQSMLAIYKRLGFSVTHNLVRWAKPLSSRSKLEKFFGSAIVGHRVAQVIDPILFGYRGSMSSRRLCEFVVLQGSCEQEFNRFDQEFLSSPGIRTTRSADYLNWRYLERPGCRHEIITARDRGALIGYVVYSAGDPAGPTIVDLNAVEDPAVIVGLLKHAARRLQKMGAATVSLVAIDSHPWRDLFARAGFHQRQTSPAIVCFASTASVSSSQFQAGWHAMNGERES